MPELERDLMKKWVKDHLDRHPTDYWLRIPDGVYGNIRPGDGVLFCGAHAILIEFKVDRRKKMKFEVEELPGHQRNAPEEFSTGTFRHSAVVVFHPATKTIFAITSTDVAHDLICHSDECRPYHES